MNDQDRDQDRDRASVAPLSVESLRVSYRSGATRQTAIDGVTFSIQAGEAYGLVGESGSGKSTVAMAIVRYLARDARIDSGRIMLAGADVNTLGARALRELRRTRLGLVYQDPARALNPTLTIGRQLVEAFELAGTRGAAARNAALDMLDRVRIPSPARAFASYPHQLSGGMQQRAVIAMALAKAPALLILDEPTTGLDATVEAEIMALVDALRRDSGATLLFISHKLPLVAGLCDRVGILQRGRLVEEGEPAELFAAPSHPYTAALLACIPTLGHTHRDGPLATLDDFAAREGTSAGAFTSIERVSRACANSGSASSALRSEPTSSSSSPSQSPSQRSRSFVETSSSTSAPIFEARGLTKSYRVGHETVCALDHVSITLRTGETLGLVGESGSGKTTLARIVAGLVRPDSGELMLDGSVLPARVETRTRTQTSAVQSVFQNPHSALNRAHRVRTLLGRAVGKLAGLRGAAREQRVRTLLDAVRLPASRLTARARELSGGQQQRVAIARAFAGEPRIVICDEPTSALDVSVQAAVLNLLVELQRTQHASYLFISHDLGVVRYVADRIAVLYRGQLVESGPADEIFARPRHPYTEALLSVASAGRVVTRGQHVESGAAPNTGSGPVSSASAGQVAVSGSTSEAATASQSATVTDTRSTASAAPRSSATGCVYAASCASSLGAQCERERPADIRISDAHTVRCHLYRTSDTAA